MADRNETAGAVWIVVGVLMAVVMLYLFATGIARSAYFVLVLPVILIVNGIRQIRG